MRPYERPVTRVVELQHRVQMMLTSDRLNAPSNYPEQPNPFTF